jgi:hypothetical protein
MSPKKGTIGPFLGIFNLGWSIEVLCLKVCKQEGREATHSGRDAYSNAGSR